MFRLSKKDKELVGVVLSKSGRVGEIRRNYSNLYIKIKNLGDKVSLELWTISQNPFVEDNCVGRIEMDKVYDRVIKAIRLLDDVLFLNEKLNCGILRRY